MPSATLLTHHRSKAACAVSSSRSKYTRSGPPRLQFLTRATTLLSPTPRHRSRPTRRVCRAAPSLPSTAMLSRVRTVRAERAATLPVVRACFARRSTSTSLGRHCEDLDATHGPILLLLYSNFLLLPPMGAPTRYSTNHSIRLQGRTDQLLNLSLSAQVHDIRQHKLDDEFPFSSPFFWMFELSELHWHGQGKEKKKGKQQRTHTQLLHIAFSRVFITFRFCFILIFLFWLAGVMERWDDANEYRYPPFFCFYRLLVVVVGWLVDTCTFLAYLLDQLLAFSNERPPLHSTSAK
jgi:hypothetical protein